MSSLVFDLETIQDLSMGPWEPPKDRPDTIAPPAYHRIVAIGYVWLDDEHKTRRMGVLGHEERPALVEFLRGVKQAQPLLVGMNTRGFDLPVLLARAFRHGIPFPFFHRGKDIWYRYGSEAHVDLMDVLCGFGAGPKSSMDAWAKLVGFPGKMGVDGKDVAGFVEAKQWELLFAYAQADAVQETAVFLRAQYIAGVLSPEGYDTAARSLLDAIAADERVAPLLSRVDRERFLTIATPVTAVAAE